MNAFNSCDGTAIALITIHYMYTIIPLHSPVPWQVPEACRSCVEELVGIIATSSVQIVDVIRDFKTYVGPFRQKAGGRRACGRQN